MKLQWIMLPLPPYSLDLAPPAIYTFRVQKDTIHGMKFENDAVT